MLPVASSVTPGISLLPRTRGPMPERKSKLPTRLACGKAPTGSGARVLSKVSLISSKLPAGDRTHDEEWFAAICDRFGQLRIRRVMRDIFPAGEEAHHRTTFVCDMIANRSAQVRILLFKRIKNGALRHIAIRFQLHFIANPGQRAQMMR